MSASDWVHLNFVECVRETDKALCFRLANRTEVWLPLSVVADADDYREGDVDGVVSVKAWFAEKEGLG